MTFDELNTELQKLVGEKVSFVRVAANSIIIYFFGEPGDVNVVSVFIDPTWRLQQQGKVIIGSYDLQIDESDFESKEGYEKEFERRASLTHSLEGTKLEEVAVDFASSDIHMRFSDGQVVSNFANSAYDDKAWTYHNAPNSIRAYVSPLGIRVQNKKE